MKKYRAATLAILVAIFGVSAVVAVNYFEPQQEQAEQAANNHRKIDTLNVLASERVAYYTKVLAIFTGTLAAFGVLQIWFLTRADNTAREAADATKRSVDTMNNTARKQLRAYVGLASAQVRFDSENPEDCFIEVRIKNYGQTPALAVISKWGEHVREWPLGSELPDIPDIPYSNSPLPPGRESIQRVPISMLNAWEVSELKAGRAGVYFWGLTTYSDIYGDNYFTRIQLVCEGEGLRGGNMHAFGSEADNAST